MEIEAWELRRQFWSQERIASQLGITQQAVSKMLARVERRELARFQKRVERTKARQTAQLETIASEAFDAWLHSKTPQVIEKTTFPAKPVDGDEGYSGLGGDELRDPEDDVAMTTREVKTHQCDSSLLAQTRGAMADIRAIWGIDSPAKAEITSTMKLFDTVNPPDTM